MSYSSINLIVYLLCLFCFVFFLIKKRIIHKKRLLVILPLILFGNFFNSNESLPFITITFLIYSILIIKYIFDLNLKTSLLIYTIYFVNISIIDVLLSIVLLYFSLFNAFKEKLNLFINHFIFFFALFPLVSKKIKKFYLKIVDKSENINSNLILYLLLFLLSIIILFFAMSLNIDIQYILLMFIIFVLFLTLTLILVNEWKEKYILFNKYTELDEYINNFEGTIDKQNLIIHEYKNQLSIIKGLSSKKDINKYIDNIIELLKTNNKIDFKGLNKLNRDGLRSLLYYKMTVSNKKGVNFILEISKDIKDYIKKLEDTKFKYLLMFLGTLIDNAIEGAEESKEKVVLFELYKINNNMKIVISNTIKDKVDLKLIEKKGYSTKGEGRGNGLSLIKRINKDYNCFDIKIEIIDNYFIVNLTIKD